MSWTISYLIFSVLSLSTPGSVITVSGKIQMAGFKVLKRGDYGKCLSVEEGERARNEIDQTINSVIESSICMGTPGWKRVAFINMTDTSYNCPTGLNLTSYSKRTCGRSHRGSGCSSTTFSVEGLLYSRVCGRIRGYQFGPTFAFRHYTQGIDSYYVDGVSLTHGDAANRQHIWTFAVGISEMPTISFGCCPCDTSICDCPAFIENDYFCESGQNSVWNSYSGRFFPDDVLWDGQNCTSTSTCCQFNNPPWFTKNLPNTTADDIELRICTAIFPSQGDIPLELIELYVK